MTTTMTAATRTRTTNLAAVDEDRQAGGEERALGDTFPVATMIDIDSLRILEEDDEEEETTAYRRADVPGRPRQSQQRRRPNRNAAADDDTETVVSAATTALASAVGSRVGERKDACLRSVTFLKTVEGDEPKPPSRSADASGAWTAPTRATEGISATATTTTTTSAVVVAGETTSPRLCCWNLKFANSGKLYSSGRNKIGISKKLSGLVVASNGDELLFPMNLGRVQSGDYLISINGRTIGPSYTAAKATGQLLQSYESDGFLSVAVGNERGYVSLCTLLRGTASFPGNCVRPLNSLSSRYVSISPLLHLHYDCVTLSNDTIVQATIIKPKPNMTYGELGMTVWYVPIFVVLCVRL